MISFASTIAFMHDLSGLLSEAISCQCLFCLVDVEDDDISFEGLCHLLHDLTVGGLSGWTFTFLAPAGPMMTCQK